MDTAIAIRQKVSASVIAYYIGVSCPSRLYHGLEFRTNGVTFIVYPMIYAVLVTVSYLCFVVVRSARPLCRCFV